MKCEIRSAIGLYKVGELSYGTCFLFKDNVYIRIASHVPTIVNLETGITEVVKYETFVSNVNGFKVVREEPIKN